MDTQWQRLHEVEATLDAAASPASGDIGSVAERWTKYQMQLFTDLELFLVCVRHVLSVASFLAKATHSGEMDAAIRRFDEASPSAKAFRDYLTHIDEYAAGRGQQRSTFAQLQDLGNLEGTVDDGALTFGGHRVPLREAHDASIRLAREAKEFAESLM